MGKKIKKKSIIEGIRKKKLLKEFLKGNRLKYWSLRLSNMQSNAKKRKHAFNLNIYDLEKVWLIQKGRCFYTKKKLYPNISIAKSEDKVLSVDRKDSKKGYDINNISFVSKAVNKMKNTLDHVIFVEFCKHIYKYKSLNKLNAVPVRSQEK